MLMEPKPRGKNPRAADDQRSELLTIWLIAVAIGLAALVLFGAIQRNIESRRPAASTASEQQVGIVCRHHTGSSLPALCR